MKQLVFHGMIWGYFSNFVLIIYKCNYLMINSCFFYLFRNYYILKWGYPQFLHFNRTFGYKQTMLGYLHLWNLPYIYICICVWCMRCVWMNDPPQSDMTWMMGSLYSGNPGRPGPIVGPMITAISAISVVWAVFKTPVGSWLYEIVLPLMFRELLQSMIRIAINRAV
jgi:hypothetical protein